MALLTSGDWPKVRRMLNAGLTTDSLPDAALSDNQAEAEEEVLEAIGKTQAQLSAGELAHAQEAARNMLAALVAPTVTFIIVGDTQAGFTRVPLDLTEVEKKRRARAQDEINEITHPDGQATAHMPTLFAIATGTRGL